MNLKKCRNYSGFNESFERKKIKKVEQYTKSGEMIAVFYSAKLAAEAMGCDADKIREVCRGERKTYRGFVWKYVVDES